MNKESGSDRQSGQMHTGYDLESGMLSRAREWTDLFPWFRLVRTLRVAGSPVTVGLVALTFVVWFNVHGWIVGDAIVDSQSRPPRVTGPAPDSLTVAVTRISDCIRQMFLIPMIDAAVLKKNWFSSFLAIGWSLVIWMPTTLYLVRQGALLTAGRDLVGIESGIRRSIRITPQAWLVAIVPLICILLFGSIIFGLGWLFALTAYAPWLRWPLLFGVAMVAIPCGILGFGASVAVPLGWAAIANEQDPDALDSLSRGYEYLYRRPLKVIWYCVLSVGILVVIVSIALAITHVGETIAIAMLALASVSEEQIGILHYLPVVVGLTLIWALLGGVYLLLRFDAGEQEVEDLWQPSPKPKPPLPQLPSSLGTNR